MKLPYQMYQIVNTHPNFFVFMKVTCWSM